MVAKMRNFLNDEKQYPYLAELINQGGRLDIGYDYNISVIAIAVDEGGTIWQGDRQYQSIGELLKEAENGVKKWVQENWE